MVISKLYIQNYRCFGEEPAVIDFAKTSLMAFVGSNNAGKSTALRVIEILLGDKWPSSQFSEDDFYKKDFGRKIVMACEFSENIVIPESRSAGGRTKSIKGLIIEVAYLSSGHGQNSTEVEFHLIETINDFSVADWQIACYGTSDKKIYVSQEIRNHLPIAITIPLIKLQSEQPSNKWSVIGKMLQKVENAFSNDQSKKTRFERGIRRVMSILREPAEFATLERDVTTFWNEVKPNNLSGTALQFLDYDPWHYYRQFHLAITKNKEDVPLETLGEGIQRLAIISLYRAYLKAHSRNQRAILLIEEPESYLHPQARSIVYKILRKAVEGTDIEGQIIYTTHSSDFLSCEFFQEIVVFTETSDGSITRQVNKLRMQSQTAALTGIDPATQIDPMIYYRLTEIDTYGLKDALFSGLAVIVEGPTDFEFLKAFGGTEEKQTSIVIAAGKAVIPAIYSFLTAFGVRTAVCIDQDNANPGESNATLASLINERRINNLSLRTRVFTEAEINSVPAGSLTVFRNLLVFARDIENVLDSRIPNYHTLTTSLKSRLNLGNSKPKLMFALKLCAEGRIPSLTLSTEQRAALETLTAEINTFLNQRILQPVLIV
ncbi:MAG: AAA family ATPase [Minisyncoccia bacterium]|jgi:predicted ATP-dependent endonuclease of OLD family